MDGEDAVEVVVGRGGGRPSSFIFLPLAVFHAAEPVLSKRSLKLLRASSRPHKLRGIFTIQTEPVGTPSQQNTFKYTKLTNGLSSERLSSP